MKKAAKTDWNKVNSLTDASIDYSDIPEATEEIFKIMVKQEPKKVMINLRLDQEVVDFFKAHSNKYQSKINEVLVALVHKYKNAHSN